MPIPAKTTDNAIRNPERTRERILSAALKEFAAKGFHGARVDVIARRASINKRMLYHYFGHKENLFKAVLRYKIAERRAWSAKLPGDPAQRLPFWFTAFCKDPDWVRLLEWEALQNHTGKVIDERERRAGTVHWLAQLRERQKRGEVTDEFDARHLALTMQSLTMFPAAFPHLTRLITGRSVSDPKFQRERAAFLKKFAEAFRPAAARRDKINSGK
jgi:AcrR family transcriptional regulator